MGPLIKSHNRNSVFKFFSRYLAFNNVYDLLKTKNEYLLLPGEIISVNSNEYIELNKNIGAYILPRLSLADTGLLYIPSYIDPCWKGILQATLVNLGEKPVTLRIGEKIAICRFYETKGDIENISQYETRFQSKSHHFGNTWNSIMVEKKIPFPTKKQYSSSFSFISFASKAIQWTRKNISNTLLVSILVFFVYYAQGLYYIKELPALVESHKAQTIFFTFEKTLSPNTINQKIELKENISTDKNREPQIIVSSTSECSLDTFNSQFDQQNKSLTVSPIFNCSNPGSEEKIIKIRYSIGFNS